MSPELESSAAGASPPEAVSPPDVPVAAEVFARCCAGEEVTEEHRQSLGVVDVLAMIPSDLPATVRDAAMAGFLAGAKYFANHYHIPVPF